MVLASSRLSQNMNFPIYDWLARRAELAPGACAVRDLGQGLDLSYSELDRRCAHTAGLFRSLGIKPQSRVALLCRNRSEFFECLFACARTRSILVPLNWRMPARELQELTDDCEPGLLIFGREDRETAQALRVKNSMDLDDNGAEGFCARRSAAPPLKADQEHQPDDAWFLLYTSGTTGTPKAVIQTYGMALANYLNISQGMGLRCSDTTLCYLPMFHSGGIGLVALPTLMMGGCVITTPEFDPAATLALVSEGAVDNFFGVPAVYQAMSLEPGFESVNLRKVRSWGCGGAALPESLLLRYAEKGAVILNGMGMTETGPTLFLMDAEAALQKPTSVGKPQLLAQARIVDEQGRDAEPGQTGELWFSGPGITPGYFRRPAETGAAFSGDGWLRSGDLARQDKDGYYYIVGRLKDMYISGGENVYPAEVERRLAAHPDILEAAVIGVPDERWGEVGCAFVLMRPNKPLPDEKALEQFLREQLAAYKIPKHYEAVGDFPRTAAGKIQKHRLSTPQAMARQRAE